MYKEKYNCGEKYSCETGRNFTIRGNGHSDNGKNSEPEKHLYQSKKVRQRKTHEAYYVMCF